MRLGAFSVSLAVKDIKVSLAFYEALGFEIFGGDIDQGWLILRNEATVIGLFQGMFDKNILTFNPGWDSAADTLAQPLAAFDDIRVLQERVKAAGLTPDQEADPNGTGPASLMLTDPDGNAILIDQHR